ncbi:MAG: hypothetical protein RML40_05840 [Bacteroidota bacterium]|nr:T9SS type A sorting domain-containing protein [Candidatus Kapabacteria bacterium]MDW8220035.1 hypothetical protein [Bacteroidota bacterium]
MWIAADILSNITSVRYEQGTPLQLAYFPHPCSDEVTIQYSVTELPQVRLELLSVLGTHLMTLVEEQQYPGDYVIPVDVRHLPSGQYFLRLYMNGELIGKPLQVIR